MTSNALRNIAFLVAATIISCDANAFWWLFRAAAGRSTVGATARAGAGALGAVEAESAMASGTGTRFCVRPVGAAACDFRASSSAIEAASRAVGPGYRVRTSAQPTIFEVLDAAGNVVSIVQAIGTDGEPSVATLPQYRPAITPPSTYEGQGAPVAIAPLRHNGDVLNVHINGTPTVVWSDGYVEVWADNNPNRVVIPPGHRIQFQNHGTVHALPKSGDAYTLFSQASSVLRTQQSTQLPAVPAIFPYGSIVPCPQVLIGNGMARCQ